MKKPAVLAIAALAAAALSVPAASELTTAQSPGRAIAGTGTAGTDADGATPAQSNAPGGATAFDPARDAAADVDAALERAAATGKSVLLVMGGSWCHDSIALADLFASQRFQTMLAPRYELVFIDVGHRDRNLDIARRFGLAGIEGTPTVLILGPDGNPRNLDDAPRWRNAASRKPDAVYRHFSRAADPVWVAE